MPQFEIPRNIVGGIWVGVSPFDGSTSTWTLQATSELLCISERCREGGYFLADLVEELSAAPSTVVLLAVELFALAKIPIGFDDADDVRFFFVLLSMLPEGDVDTDGIVKWLDQCRYRDAHIDDETPSRFKWCIHYAARYASYLDRNYIRASGQRHYQEGFRLPDLVIGSPWAAASLSASVPFECPGMRNDLDHMLWPDFLPPPHVRVRDMEICAENSEILLEDCFLDETQILKNLYIAKQLWGSWEKLAEGSGTRTYLSSLHWEDSW